MEKVGPSLAPVAIFIFKRPAHLNRLLRSLRECDEFNHSPVYVFGDGPRFEYERPEVEAARQVAEELLGNRVTYRFAHTSTGLASSLIAGVSEVLAIHGRVIVLEDDLEVSNSFLRYMNLALDRYADSKHVMSICGYMEDVPQLKASGQAQVLPMFNSWGWATWGRAWNRFDTECRAWDATLRDPVTLRAFNLDGHYPYGRMLRKQMTGKLDSWAIRWYFSIFNSGGVCVYPPRSLVRNTGFDGSGTHSSVASGVQEPDLEKNSSIQFPDELIMSEYKDAIFRRMRLTLFLTRLGKLQNRLKTFAWKRIPYRGER